VITPFERSAEFYDELYEGKDYAAEAHYVDGVIQRHLPGASSLLDLGCGTGRHAIEFTEKGYAVVGVDRSPEMIGKAQRRREQLRYHIRERLTFEQGDIRDFRADQKFDAVVALFHVISYQTSNNDLLAALTTARTHLRENGLFIFDCWYGPGVLTDRPTVRAKTLYNGSNELTRFAEPVMSASANAIEVNYRFEFKNKATNQYSEFHERHVMRYFFIPELFLALQMVQFETLGVTEWMSNHEPALKTWSIAVVARA
jgi:SAM-dependent methyltransferase